MNIRWRSASHRQTCAAGNRQMDEVIQIGDRVKVRLDAKVWKSAGWFEGTVVRIDPYSKHRSFYWVQLDDAEFMPGAGAKLISVLNPKNIQKA